MTSAIASRYAGALVDVVTGPAAKIEPRAVLAELQAFEQLLAESPELNGALLSPAVPPARKRALVERLAAMLPLSPLTMRFLFVLLDHRRTAILSGIREAFEILLDERLGVVRVEVASARELTPAQREAIEAALAQVTGRQPRAQFSTDSGLIGGVVARVGSTIYDGSVRGQLETLKHRLATAEV